MTREMNKPDWCNKWVKKYDYSEIEKLQKVDCLTEVKGKWKTRERVLDDWIKPFVDSVNERFKQC